MAVRYFPTHRLRDLRELVIMRRANQTVLSSPSPIDGPVIYEFRLAHR